MPRTHSDEWWEQGVRCRLYDKKGKPGVPEYVTCFNDGWPKNERLMVYVKAGERPTEAVLSYDKFSKAVAFAQAYSAGGAREKGRETQMAQEALGRPNPSHRGPRIIPNVQQIIQ